MKDQAYNSMCEDGFDQKIPLHDDEAFQHGIQFQIKVTDEIEQNVFLIDFFHLVHRFIRSAETNKSN